MKHVSPDWIPLANAALGARDGLRNVLPVLDELEREIGSDARKRALLNRIRSVVLAQVHGLRLAVKGRPAARQIGRAR